MYYSWQPASCGRNGRVAAGLGYLASAMHNPLSPAVTPCLCPCPDCLFHSPCLFCPPPPSLLTIAACGWSLMESAEPSWKGKLKLCCCWGHWKVATPSRTNTNPLSPRLLADRVVPFTTSTHAVDEPGTHSSKTQADSTSLMCPVSNALADPDHKKSVCPRAALVLCQPRQQGHATRTGNSCSCIQRNHRDHITAGLHSIGAGRCIWVC